MVIDGVRGRLEAHLCSAGGLEHAALNSTEISELIKQRIAQFNVVSEAHNEEPLLCFCR